jgi:excisionase family DNA binding protein
MATTPCDSLVRDQQVLTSGSTQSDNFGLGEGNLSAATQALGHREILDIKAAAEYLGVSRSHLSHLLAGRVAGVPAIPHVRAGRRALIRRTVIDQWIQDQEQGAGLERLAQ